MPTCATFQKELRVRLPDFCNTDVRLNDLCSALRCTAAEAYLESNGCSNDSAKVTQTNHCAHELALATESILNDAVQAVSGRLSSLSPEYSSALAISCRVLVRSVLGINKKHPSIALSQRKLHKLTATVSETLKLAAALDVYRCSEAMTTRKSEEKIESILRLSVRSSPLKENSAINNDFNDEIAAADGVVRGRGETSMVLAARSVIRELNSMSCASLQQLSTPTLALVTALRDQQRALLRALPHFACSTSLICDAVLHRFSKGKTGFRLRS
ncbi:MAG: hypothetical protein MHM6MM_003188 [Cercozoa sp. M6MM]